MSTIQKIKGFSDLLPPEVDKYVQLEDTARQHFSRYGYREMRIPMLEKTELFARSIGDDTDVVQKEMYTFDDRKGRSLTLRPEATAGVVRAYIENNLKARENVSKYFTIGPMFRYERPQKGRMRQFHQINAEIFNAAGPQADAELMTMLWTYLRSLGLTGLRLEVNSLGCRSCRPDFQAALKEHLQTVDVQGLCQDCRQRSQHNPMRIYDCKVEACQGIIAQAPTPMDLACQDCKDHFQTVLEIIADSNIDYQINPKLVRGLDYYQRTTFEVVSDHIGAQSSVAGGGRYDGLVSDLGGPEVPGIGFACGMERLALLLDDPGPPRQDFYLAVLDDQGLTLGHTLAHRLRQAGLSGMAGFEARSPKSQLREANKLGVRTCLLLGADELEKDQVQIKDMRSGSQQLVKQTDIETAVSEIVTSYEEA
jgi:histidyl-tRNA synthetase